MRKKKTSRETNVFFFEIKKIETKKTHRQGQNRHLPAELALESPSRDLRLVVAIGGSESDLTQGVVRRRQGRRDERRSQRRRQDVFQFVVVGQHHHPREHEHGLDLCVLLLSRFRRGCFLAVSRRCRSDRDRRSGRAFACKGGRRRKRRRHRRRGPIPKTTPLIPSRGDSSSSSRRCRYGRAQRPSACVRG